MSTSSIDKCLSGKIKSQETYAQERQSLTPIEEAVLARYSATLALGAPFED
jgi:hypothetical protein